MSLPRLSLILLSFALASGCAHEVIRRDPAAAPLAKDEVETSLGSRDVKVGSAVSFHQQSCRDDNNPAFFNTKQARCHSLQTATGVVTRVLSEDSSIVRITDGGKPAPGVLVLKD